MSAAESYTKEVHKQLQRYATWLPAERVTVGDVGVLRNNIFTREAHLTDFGINAATAKDSETNATYKFMSAKTTEAQGSAGAAGTLPQGVAGKADLTIGFGRKHSVYFFLTNCVGSKIENQLKLGSEILKRVKTKEWKFDYVVVTRVVNAGSATIFQSESKHASVVFKGTGRSPALELLSAGAKVKFNAEAFSGFSAVGERDLTPLFTLGKVDYSFFDFALRREPNFSATNVKTAKIGVSRLQQIVESSPNINFASPPGTNSDREELAVILPKSSGHVDINNLVDFAVKAHDGKAFERMSYLDQCNTRIQSKRIRALVNKTDSIELEPRFDDNDFYCLNVTLRKKGTAVDFGTLLDFAVDAVEPKAMATITADLSFHEID